MSKHLVIINYIFNIQIAITTPPKKTFVYNNLRSYIVSYS